MYFSTNWLHYLVNHVAGYIPDGCPGPVCFSQQSDHDNTEVGERAYVGCWNRPQRVGWEVVMNDYYIMLWWGNTRLLSKTRDAPTDMCVGAQIDIASCLWYWSECEARWLKTLCMPTHESRSLWCRDGWKHCVWLADWRFVWRIGTSMTEGIMP